MSNLFQKRFQLQLLFALVAAVSVAALTIELVVNAVRHAEGFVLADTKRTLNHAIQELDRESALRQHPDTGSGTPWADLPLNARDLTLRAISQTVLASYPGVEGGFWLPSQFAGYSYPTHDGGSPKIDVPEAERPAIEDVIHDAQRHGSAEKVLRGKHDLIVISAAFETGEPVASWAMKRLSGQAEPAQRTENILLSALVVAALLGAAGVLATGVGLHRGIAQITSGLAALQHDFEPALPVRRDELGRISAAINEMARTRRSLEAEVRREDRARTVGRMIGRIAHEMRNPLNSIRLSLQMLAQRQEQNRLQSGDFRMVLDEVDRLNRLLSDLLAFQQPRPPKIEPGAVCTVLEESAQLVTPQALRQGVSLVVLSGPGQTALFDREYFRQIMVNLILNAVEVSLEGERVNIRSTVSNGSVSIEVSDHGPGLTPDQEEHIFEPFYTTKTTGHGLGLAVSRELAQSMGGTLSFRSEAALGSLPGATFILQLRSQNGN